MKCRNIAKGLAGVAMTGMLVFTGAFTGTGISFTQEVSADEQQQDVSFKVEYVNGMNCIVGMSGHADNLVIPSEVNGQKIDAIYERALQGKDMKTLVIPDTIYVGHNAFRYCTKLEKVTILGENVVLGHGAFSGCTALKSVSFSKGDYITDYVFENCSSLEKVSLAEGMTIGYRAFSGIQSLKKLTIPAGIKTVEGEAFSNTGLEKVKFEGNPESIGDGMFMGCKNLKNVKLPEGMTVIPGKIFMDCSALERADVPQSVTKILYDAYKNCTSFKGTVLWDTIEEVGDESFLGVDKSATFGIFTSQMLFLHVYYGGFNVKILEPGQTNDDLLGSYVVDMSDYYNLNNDGGTWDGAHYYLDDGSMVYNSFFCDGTYTYYLQADGTPMKDRLTYHPDGVHIIYFDEDGHEVFSDFSHISKSIAGADVDDMCFFNVFGYMYVDTLTYDKTGTKLYYVNPYGVLERNGWFEFSGHEFDAGLGFSGVAGGYGYANSDCSLMVNTNTYDKDGNLVYMQGDGHMVR